MKYLSRIISILLIVLVTGCNHKDSNPSPYFLSSTMSNGGSLHATGSQVSSSITAQGLQIYATASGARLTLWQSDYAPTVGSFALNDTTGGGIYFLTTNDPLPHRSVHGTLTITSVSPNLEGSFVFTSADSIVFTGTFDAPAP